QIPQRDIERRLEALRDGEEELCRRRRDDDEDGNLGEQRELARLQAVILGERQRDEPRRQADVIQPRQRYAPLWPSHPHPAEARDQIVAFADEEGGKGTEDDAID